MNEEVQIPKAVYLSSPTIKDLPEGVEADEWYRDKGGRLLKGGKWRIFNFEVEVAVETPKESDEDEAAEDAAEFMATVQRTQGRVHTSFASITHIKELPTGAEIVAQRKLDEAIEIANANRTAGKPAAKVTPVQEEAYEDAVPTLTKNPGHDRIKVKPKKGVKKGKKKASKM